MAVSVQLSKRRPKFRSSLGATVIDFSYTAGETENVKNRLFIIYALCCVMLAGFPAAAHANGGPPAATKIVACTDGNRGVVVCYQSATIERGLTQLDVEIHFELFFQDESDPEVFGEGGAGFVVRAEFGGVSNPVQEGGPLAGDVGAFTILYPRTQADPFFHDGTGANLRGVDLAAGAFAITTASNFDFTKTLKTVSSREVIEFVINKTYRDSWYRLGCEFLIELDGDGNPTSVDPDTGFLFPTDACESPNLEPGNSANSVSYVPNNISFYTPLTFVGFVNAASDGGYLNYEGAGLQWFVEEATQDMGGAFQFQLVGPKFASGSDPNFGSLQAFIPQVAMAEIFGNDFNPAAPAFQAARVDASPEGRTVQDLVSENAVVTSSRNGGLLIEVPSYGFSAPAFSFASNDRPRITESNGDAPTGGGSTVATPTAQPELAATGAGHSWGFLGLSGASLAVVGVAMVFQSARLRNHA